MSKKTFGPSDLKTHLEKNGRSWSESDTFVFHFWHLLKNEDLNKCDNLYELEEIFFSE